MDTRSSPTREHPHPPPRQALVGWRLLSLLYDLWPVLAMWMLVAVPYVLAYTFLGGHDTRQNIAPLTPWWWAQWLTCLTVTGVYAVLSWRRGGQTLGMRPWRLKVVAVDGGAPRARALATRYLVGCVSVLAGGMGFWWAFVDRDRLAWHDRASGTRMIRLPKTAGGS